MIANTINNVLQRIAQRNPLFGDRYFFVDPNTEQENVTISDNMGNHFFATFPSVANGANVTFTPALYSGCGSYIMRSNINLYFVLEPCYNSAKAFQILGNHIAALDSVTINSGGYDAKSIYASLTNEVMPRAMTLLYYSITVQSETVLGEDCSESICEDICC